MFHDPGAFDVRNRGLRLAFAVALGLIVETARGAALPPLASVIALQLLVAMHRPPPMKVVVMLFVLIGGAGFVAYAAATLSLAYAGVYTITVALLYLWGFSLCFSSVPAVIGSLAVTMIAVVTSFAAASTAAAGGLVRELATAVILGVFLVYLSHALFPHRGPPPAPRPPPEGEAASLSPTARALLATLVMMPLQLYLVSDGVAAAVVLLTTATMLRQPGVAQSTRYSLAFALGNALGASLAALSAVVLSLHAVPLVMISTTVAGSLVMSWLLVRDPRYTPVFAPGFVAYAMLYGLVLSPLPIADSVAVIDRVVLIVGAAIYALAAVSLLVPLAARLSRWSGRAPA